MDTPVSHGSLSETHAALIESKRKISCETCARLGIISHPARPAIGFPTYTASGAQPETSSTIAYTKWRSAGKGFWIEPGGQRLRLWNLPPVADIAHSPERSIVITEGEFDAASFVEIGILACSVPNGAAAKEGDDKEREIDPLRDRQFAYLWTEEGELIPELQAADRVILAVDDDKPGKLLGDELAVRIGPGKCFFVDYPKGCKDANEVLVKHGPEALREVYETAVPIVPNRLLPPSQVKPLSRGGPYLSGWSEMDFHLKLCPPELVIVTGVPGAGKTQWAGNWLMNVSRWSGERGAIIQFEDSVERLQEDIREFEAAWKSAPRSPTYPGWGDDHLLIVGPQDDDEEEQDLEWLERMIWEAANRHSCKWIMIDPWNEISHIFDSSHQREDQYLNAAVRRLKKLCRRYQIALVIVAHPDKHGGRNEDVDSMTLYSISGGAVWKNKADGGIIVGKESDIDPSTGKPKETGRSVVKVDKRKDWSRMGRPGRVTFDFDPKHRIYRVHKGDSAHS